jgi:prophage regulatory protein
MTDRVLRIPEVIDLVGLSVSTIYAMIADGRFPRPIKLGKRAVGWKESTIDAWLASCRF